MSASVAAGVGPVTACLAELVFPPVAVTPPARCGLAAVRPMRRNGSPRVQGARAPHPVSGTANGSNSPAVAPRRNARRAPSPGPSQGRKNAVAVRPTARPGHRADPSFPGQKKGPRSPADPGNPCSPARGRCDDGPTTAFDLYVYPYESTKSRGQRRPPRGAERHCQEGPSGTVA